jgi:hypothetical protein
MAQVFHFFFEEGAFGRLQLQSSLQMSFQNSIEISEVSMEIR